MTRILIREFDLADCLFFQLIQLVTHPLALRFQGIKDKLKRTQKQNNSNSKSV